MSDDRFAFEGHTLTEYEDFVTGLMSPHSMRDPSTKLATAGLGLGGEGGEVADLVKKILFHGLEFDENVRQKLIKELGDIMFYVAFAARNVCNTTLREVIEANIEKLSARYKTGKFTTQEFIDKEKSKE